MYLELLRDNKLISLASNNFVLVVFHNYSSGSFTSFSKVEDWNDFSTWPTSTASQGVSGSHAGDFTEPNNSLTEIDFHVN